MKILLVTDAWDPQINGVVNTLKHLKKNLPAGHTMDVCHPFLPNAKAYAWSPYEEVRFLKNPREVFLSSYNESQPDHIHICTEGSLGIAARRWCVKNQVEFTTSFHSRFDLYMWRLYRIPGFITRTFLRWFHNRAERVLVPTDSIKNYLDGKGFKNVAVWDRGVELEKFPYQPDLREENTIIMVSRASKEKNIDDFCRITGRKKIFVGGGPYLEELKRKYPNVEFVGNFPYDRIAEQYNRACVFVFPSWFDTFGIVNLEAMACGLPVAAYPAPGPVDLVTNGFNGWIDKDLQYAVDKCFENLETMRENSLAFARKRSWKTVAERFAELIQR